MNEPPGLPPDRDNPRGELRIEPRGKRCRIAIVVIVASLFLIGIVASLLDLGTPA
ncbi:MAG: hypothetical protein OXE02_02750 [Chloroflexi bacterium]|nr:hypothetical protein [Chloroflexota bacterium]